MYVCIELATKRRTLMYLVTQGRGRVNQLGYDSKKKEYVYLHKGQEIWREKGDESLLNYFNYIRSNYACFEEEEIEKLSTHSIWEKYDESCHQFELEEYRQLWGK